MRGRIGSSSGIVGTFMRGPIILNRGGGSGLEAEENENRNKKRIKHKKGA